MAKKESSIKSFVLRVDAETMDAIEKWAADEFRSTNGQLQWIIAEALKKSRGKYFPTGWIDLLKAFRKNDTIDLLLIAVRPDYQKKGVNAMILYNAMQGCHKLGIKEAETGPMLETNEKVQSQWKDFDIEQHKRRRCFIKKLK